MSKDQKRKRKKLNQMKEIESLVLSIKYSLLPRKKRAHNATVFSKQGALLMGRYAMSLLMEVAVKTL